MYYVHIPYARHPTKAMNLQSQNVAHCLLQEIIGGQSCGMEIQTLESHDRTMNSKWEPCLLWKFGIWKHGFGLHGQ